MPTIEFSLKDLESLIKKKLDIKRLTYLLDYAKAELESYDKKKNEVKIKLEDTNLPYLWSVEGLARLFKGVLGIEKGLAKFKLSKREKNNKIIVDNALSSIRPFIAAFIVKNCKLNDYIIKQVIQLQEKLCENYGRKREKIAIGVYKLEQITFPVYYKAVEPSKTEFVPLNFNKKLNLNQILAQHPKGIAYHQLLKGFTKYPLLIDSKKRILSFPPIINSEECGKVDAKDHSLLLEVTGIDLTAVHLAANIFAHTFYDRKCSIHPIEINYSNKKIITPSLFNEKIKISASEVEKILGLKLKKSQIKSLLEKARFSYKNDSVLIPHYRKDIMNTADVIEDIGIMYDYNKIPDRELKNYTRGHTFPIFDFINKVRELMIGLGYQEILSPILSNKKTCYKKMDLQETGEMVEIENPMSETYSAVRTSLIPILIETLSKNKHVEYPQKIFEQGLVTKKHAGLIKDSELLSVLASHKKADYTEIRQIIDYILNTLKIEYTIEESSHPSFIPGRAASIIVGGKIDGKEIAFLGELHPAVLKNFGLEMPAVALELDVGVLHKLIKK